MLNEKKDHPKEKSKIHPRSKHRERYDFEKLIARCPELAPFVRENPYGDLSIDFANPEAVKTLNTSLLLHFYEIENWEIPVNYLCPPIPGRADYIHHMADLLALFNQEKIPTGSTIKGLDIGVGASCIYPIIGIKEYGWSFTGTDIDPVALKSAQSIIESNVILKGNLDLRLQPNMLDTLRGIIKVDECFDFTICNPPFHKSAEEAKAGNMRKLSNLGKKNISHPALNFGGKHNELWCEGGEIRFVKNLIQQSTQYPTSCFWFSTLISKDDNLKSVYRALNKAEVVEIHTIEMGQGNKTSRIVAWTFLTRKQQKEWAASRWTNNQ